MRINRTALAAGAAAGTLAAVAACGGSSASGSASRSSAVANISGPAFVSSQPATSTPSASASTSTPTPTPTPTPTVTVTDSPGPAAPSPAPATTVTATAPATTGPVPRLTNSSAVVEQYYQDITNHDYAAAWALGGSNIAGESYPQYVAGFSTTARIALGTVSEFGASQVQAVLYATQTDGTVKVYQGTYTVANGVLVGASIRQTA